MTLSRRDFMAAAGAGAVGALVGGGWAATDAVDPVTQVDNPLREYPNRDWEEVYHVIYAYDKVDWTVCHPNCTQSCALNFYMKNGVPIRAEQVYHQEEASPGPGGPGGYENADVSQHWNPRGCMKGLTVPQGLGDRSDDVKRTAKRALAEARGEDPENIDLPDPAAPGGGPDRPEDGPAAGDPRAGGGPAEWAGPGGGSPEGGPGAPATGGRRPRGPDAGTHGGDRR